MTDVDEPICAGVFYLPKSKRPPLLAEFAAELAGQGIRVGGIVQTARIDDEGVKSGIDAIELDTGRRISINRPTAESRAAKECTLQPHSLSDSTAAIRRALDDGVDLIIIEKFGEQEQKGKGMADDIMAAMASGIPTLIAVPTDGEATWEEATGGLAEKLPHEMDALRGWWQRRGRVKTAIPE